MTNLKEMTKDELLEEYSYQRDMMDTTARTANWLEDNNSPDTTSAWAEYTKRNTLAMAAHNELIARDIRVTR